MQLIKCNNYQSWAYKSDEACILVDPWLSELQEIPSARWLLYREKTSDHYFLRYNLIDKVTHLVITAHFSDHLDPESLEYFDKDITIFTTKHASHALSKLGFTNITVVKTGDKFNINEMTLEIEEAGRPYNTTSFAYYLHSNGKTVFHEPHTINKNFVSKYPIEVLISTTDLVKVFGMVMVSMSYNRLKKIIDKNHVEYMASTGSKPSDSKGLLSRVLYIKEENQNDVFDDCRVCSNSYDSFVI